MMYGETAQSDGYSDVKAPRPVPALGQLKAAAERVYKVNDRIESFIGRFQGQLPAPAGVGAAAGQPLGDTYRNDIESLFAIVERLETSAEALDHIG